MQADVETTMGYAVDADAALVAAAAAFRAAEAEALEWSLHMDECMLSADEPGYADASAKRDAITERGRAALDLLTRVGAAGIAGLLAKAKALLAFIPMGLDEWPDNSDDELGWSLALDVVRLSAECRAL
jgi:hypothetical protein